MLHTPSLPHFESSDRNGSNDDILNQQSYTSATKMSPWRPKMATEKDFVKKAVHEFIGTRVEGEASLSLTSKDGKVTLATEYPPKTPSSPYP